MTTTAQHTYHAAIGAVGLFGSPTGSIRLSGDEIDEKWAVAITLVDLWVLAMVALSVKIDWDPLADSNNGAVELVEYGEMVPGNTGALSFNAQGGNVGGLLHCGLKTRYQ